MVGKTILVLLLFLGFLPFPGFLLAMWHGNWLFAFILGMGSIFFLGCALLYSMLSISGEISRMEERNADSTSYQ